LLDWGTGLIGWEAFNGYALLLLVSTANCSSFAVFVVAYTDLDELALFLEYDVYSVKMLSSFRF